MKNSVAVVMNSIVPGAFMTGRRRSFLEKRLIWACSGNLLIAARVHGFAGSEMDDRRFAPYGRRRDQGRLANLF